MMGLDMFLFKKNQLEEEMIEVCYWRKLNGVDDWWIEDIQNGVYDKSICYVTERELKELLDLCIEVKSKMRIDENGRIDNKEDMEKLLPVREGLILSFEEHDDWYIDKVNKAIEQLNNLIKTTDFNKEIIYYNCYW